MTADLAALMGGTQEVLALGFVVFLRLGPLIGFMPAIGEQVVPTRVKLALLLCFTLAVLPVLSERVNTPLETHGFVPLVVSETAVGLFFGLALRFFVITLQTAGSMAAQATSLAQLFAGNAAEPMPAIGHLLVVGGLALAMIMGLPLRVLELVVASYDAFPVGGGVDYSLAAEWAGKLVSKCFALAFSIAAPFLIMSLLYNLTLGVINRAMPQLMVAFVGAPVITAGGLIFMLLFCGLMLSVWWQALAQFLARPEVFVQ